MLKYFKTLKQMKRKAGTMTANNNIASQVSKANGLKSPQKPPMSLPGNFVNSLFL